FLMNAELESLLSVTLPSSAGPRDIRLKIPPMCHVHLLISDPVARDAAALGRKLPLMAMEFVASVDGKPLELPEANELAKDAELMRGMLLRIRTMLDTLREKGSVFVLCPGCRKWETEVSFTDYALTIAAPLPSTFDGPFLALPSSAGNLVAGL